jgi:hypothetical protein
VSYLSSPLPCVLSLFSCAICILIRPTGDSDSSSSLRAAILGVTGYIYNLVLKATREVVVAPNIPHLFLATLFLREKFYCNIKFTITFLNGLWVVNSQPRV